MLRGALAAGLVALSLSAGPALAAGTGSGAFDQYVASLPTSHGAAAVAATPKGGAQGIAAPIRRQLSKLAPATATQLETLVASGSAPVAGRVAGAPVTSSHPHATARPPAPATSEPGLIRALLDSAGGGAIVLVLVAMALVAAGCVAATRTAARG